MICAEGNRPAATPARSGRASCELDGEGPGNPQNQQDDEDFDIPELELLEIEHQQDVGCRQAHPPHQRQPEKQIEGDGRADHLREIAGRDRELAEQPQDDRRRPRIVIAARLSEIPPAGDAEPQGERLQQDRHQVRQHDHAEERVAVSRSSREVGRPVAGIHVTDRNQVTGAGEREQLLPEAARIRNRDRPVHFRKADGRRRPAPAADGMNVAGRGSRGQSRAHWCSGPLPLIGLGGSWRCSRIRVVVHACPTLHEPKPFYSKGKLQSAGSRRRAHFVTEGGLLDGARPLPLRQHLRCPSHTDL